METLEYVNWENFRYVRGQGVAAWFPSISIVRRTGRVILDESRRKLPQCDHRHREPSTRSEEPPTHWISCGMTRSPWYRASELTDVTCLAIYQSTSQAEVRRKTLTARWFYLVGDWLVRDAGALWRVASRVLPARSWMSGFRRIGSLVSSVSAGCMCPNDRLTWTLLGLPGRGRFKLDEDFECRFAREMTSEISLIVQRGYRHGKSLARKAAGELCWDGSWNAQWVEATWLDRSKARLPLNVGTEDAFVLKLRRGRGEVIRCGAEPPGYGSVSPYHKPTRYTRMIYGFRTSHADDPTAKGGRFDLVNRDGGQLLPEALFKQLQVAPKPKRDSGDDS